jgi:hypothetical protein
LVPASHPEMKQKTNQAKEEKIEYAQGKDLQESKFLQTLRPPTSAYVPYELKKRKRKKHL